MIAVGSLLVAKFAVNFIGTNECVADRWLYFICGTFDLCYYGRPM